MPIAEQVIAAGSMPANGILLKGKWVLAQINVDDFFFILVRVVCLLSR